MNMAGDSAIKSSSLGSSLSRLQLASVGTEGALDTPHENLTLKSLNKGTKKACALSATLLADQLVQLLLQPAGNTIH